MSRCRAIRYRAEVLHKSSHSSGLSNSFRAAGRRSSPCRVGNSSLVAHLCHRRCHRRNPPARTVGIHRREVLGVLGEPATSLLVADHDGCLVGLAVVRFGAPCPSGARSAVELQTLYVQEHFIGQGIGRSLLQAAEAEARERSASSLWLTVNARHSRAIALYADQGYAKIGTTHFVLGDARHENHVLLGSVP